ncbi:hypothetical protein GCM10007377_16120 [Galliscardovia ingluviei]|uniref:FtsK domain-containing protein n=2 Tax=Galliscardovia ingluviei TaxID=1769422 RepID=A0A8J3ARB2_9BIFI|nr:hypothetical protein GCM10007377_16120 [Galliscardovia ingluviei]
MPVILIGSIISIIINKPPQSPTSRRSDPPLPRHQRAYDRWSQYKRGLLHPLDGRTRSQWGRWMNIRRVSWWLGISIGLMVSFNTPWWGTLANTVCAWLTLMGISARTDRKTDKRHPNRGVSIPAFITNAATPTRIIMLVITILAYPLSAASRHMLLLAAHDSTPLWSPQLIHPSVIGMWATLTLTILYLIDRPRQTETWQQIINAQQTIDEWKENLSKSWEQAYVTDAQTITVGDCEPVTVIKVRLTGQDIFSIIRNDQPIIASLASEQHYRWAQLLANPRQRGNREPDFDLTQVRVILANNEQQLPNLTTPGIDNTIATLITDMAYAHASNQANKPAPLTYTFNVSANPEEAPAWLTLISQDRTHAIPIEEIGLRWLPDENGTTRITHLPAFCDFDNRFHLYAEEDTELSNEGNPYRHPEAITSSDSFNDYIALSRRYSDEDTNWHDALPSIVQPPIPDYDSEYQQEYAQYAVTVTPYQVSSLTDMHDMYDCAPLAMHPDCANMLIAPTSDYTIALLTFYGTPPLRIDLLTINDEAGELQARALAYRALNNALLQAQEARIINSRLETNGNNPVWSFTISLNNGATLTQLRKKQNSILTDIGAHAILWETLPDGNIVMYALNSTPPLELKQLNQWRIGSRQKALIELILADAWGAIGLTNSEGQAPQVTDLKPLPHNHDVLIASFLMPAGLAESRFNTNLDKYLTQANYFYGRLLPRGEEHGARGFDMILAKQSPFPTKVMADWQLIRQTDYLTLPFAVDDLGAPVSWDLTNTYHIAVMGGTGTGKSSLMQILVADALIKQWNIIIIDPSKGAMDFTQWAKPRALNFVGLGQLRETEATVSWLVNEMEQRAKLMSEHGVGNIRLLPEETRPHPILLVFDELNGYLGRHRQEAANPGRDTDIAQSNAQIREINNSLQRTMTALSRIALEGRASGIHLLLGGQRLSLDDFRSYGGDAFYRSLARVLLGNGEAAGVVSQNNIVAAHRLQNGIKSNGGTIPVGRGIWQNAEGALNAIQTYYGGKQDSLLEQVQHIPEITPVDVSMFMPNQTAQLGNISAEELLAEQDTTTIITDTDLDDAEEIEL